MALKYTWQWCSRLKNYFRDLDTSWSSKWLPDLNEVLLVSTLFLGYAIFLNKNVITAHWYSSFRIEKPWLIACLVITIWIVLVRQWNCTTLIILLGLLKTERTAYCWDKNVSLFTTVTFAPSSVNHKDVKALLSVQVSISEKMAIEFREHSFYIVMSFSLLFNLFLRVSTTRSDEQTGTEDVADDEVPHNHILLGL